MHDLVRTDNAARHKLRPIGGPEPLLSKMRLLACGPILEDIVMYNRAHEMFIIFTTTDSRENHYAEGFGNYWEHVADNSHVHADYAKGVPVSSSQTVLFKPLSGSLSQRTYLPILFYATHN